MKKRIGLSVIVGLLAFCSSSNAQNPPFIPGSAESVGLTRIVPDTLVWYNMTTMSPQIGGFIPGTRADTTPGSAVEAGARLLGDSTFLLAASLKATNDSAMMSFTSVLIPADGRPPKLNNLFYDDSGKMYGGPINLSRQTGNPGRNGGDMRYGAVNFMGAGEVSLYAYPEFFNSDGRFDTAGPFWGAVAGVNGRSYGVQLHRMDPLNRTSTPIFKAVDSAFGRLWTNSVPVASPPGDIGRAGSSPLGLANGNFVCIAQEGSKLNNPNGNAAIATIYAPDGSIVKEAFKVTPDDYGFNGGFAGRDMWDNVGAWRGGFFVKPGGGITYFFDNDGNPQGSITNNADAGVWFDNGRSDGTRMCSDIRSKYVFMAGKSPEANPGFTNMMLCAWDAKTRLWITNTVVSEGKQDPLDTGGVRFMDRANVACDAYDRVTVVYRLKPDNSLFPNDQIAARVFQFTGTNFIPLTPSFFAFIQHDGTNVLTGTPVGFLSKEPSVAMTPREIMIYAEGIWNGTASPTNAIATANESHCYTIVSHPAPIAAPRPQMTLAYGTPNSTISWQADAGLFVLQSTATPEVAASWADVSPQPTITRTAYVDPSDKYEMSVPNGTSPKFYRLIRRW